MKVYTVPELAAEWRCSPDVIYDLLRSARLSGFKVGGLWRITEEAKTKYETAPPAPPERRTRARVEKIHI
jgi:excisionase family DNA binding protein